MNRQKRKGDRYEKDIAKKLKEHGHDVTRVNLSLQAGRQFKGDIVIHLKDKDVVGEVKYRQDGFKTIYKWLTERDVLFIKARRKEWLLVLRVKDMDILK